MNKITYSFIVVGIATLAVVGVVGAFSYTGNTDSLVVVEGDLIEGESMLGSGGRVISAANLSAVSESIIPDTNNAYDIGSSGLKWKDGYFAGTVQAGFITVDQIINETLNVGNGSATTTINGSSTSTFPNDLSAENLYLGKINAPIDGGLVDVMDIPVSASAVTSTAEGYNFNVDGLPVLSVQARSDAQGLVWENKVIVGTGGSSSTLYANSTGIYKRYPNGMCDGEDSTTTTPNLTTQLCTSF